MKNWKLPFALLLICTTWSACRKDELKDFGPEITTTFTGVITNEEGETLSGAKVIAGDKAATTDRNGVFRLDGVKLPAHNAILRVSQTGYFEFSRAWFIEDGAVTTADIQLLKKVEIKSFDAANEAEVQAGGATIRFPANSLALADGSLYSGLAYVSARYLDPTSPDLAMHMPGDLRGINSDGDEQVLATFGMIGVEILSLGGRALNIRTGKEVELNVPIPADQQSVAPAEIPLWYFDLETARWIEEGVAQKVGGSYVGKVKHFTWWNLDDPMSITNLSGHVYAGNTNTPLTNAGIRLTSLSSGFKSTYRTNDSGWFGGAVPKDAIMKMEVLIDEQCGNQVLYTKTIGPFSGDFELPAIVISDDNADFFTVSGRLVDCNQKPLPNGYLFMANGDHEFFVYVDEVGVFQKTVVLCNAQSLQITGYDSDYLKQSSTLSFSSPTANLQTGDISVCTPLEEYISINIGLDNTNYFFKNNVSAHLYSPETEISGAYGGKQIIFVFRNTGDTGTFPVDVIKIAPLPSIITSSDVNVTISAFSSIPGGSVIGSIHGTVNYGNGQTVPVSGSFQVKQL